MLVFYAVAVTAEARVVAARPCAACRRRGLPGGSGANRMKEGGIYSIDNGDGKFGIVKILKLESGIVHVRIYKEKFATRPESIKVEQLSLGSIKDKDGFGIGHLPISKNDFTGWKAVFLCETEVKEDELEGYNMWKEAGGGVFGR
jgi:hypothetical protein